MIKIYRSLIATLLFLVTMIGIYYIHIRYFKVNVVFYSSLTDGALAIAIIASALVLLKYFDIIGSFEKLLLVIIWILMSYSAAISIPTVIDRSLSFYILEKIQQRGGGIRQDSFSEIFIQEYLPEHRLVDVRLTEQLKSGTVFIKGGCVLLTSKGKRIAQFGRYFRTHWLPKQRLLMGQYSDDLTDPFRKSGKPPLNYTCQEK